MIILYFKYRSARVKINLYKEGWLWDQHGSMGVLVFCGMAHIPLPKDNQQACKMLLELEMVM
jgi:hypothetical protein